MAAVALPPRLLSLWQPLRAFYQKHAAYAPPVVLALALVLMPAPFARLFWGMFPAGAWQPLPVPVSSGQKSFSIDSLIAGQWFGSYAVAAPSAAQAASAPDTALNLTLLGILYGQSESQSLALISKEANDEAPYKVGVDVSPGVRLQAIFPDRVILSRNGQLETLRLDKNQPSNADVPVQASTEGAMNPVTAQMLTQIRNEVAVNPNKASTYIRLQPMTDGAFRGYRIYPGQDTSVFAAAGLRPGDIVTAVNGQALGDQQQDMAKLEQLQAATQLTLTINRDGQNQNISLNLGN
jgi:general secretion pathway protein C